MTFQQEQSLLRQLDQLQAENSRLKSLLDEWTRQEIVRSRKDRREWAWAAALFSVFALLVWLWAIEGGV